MAIDSVAKLGALILAEWHEGMSAEEFAALVVGFVKQVQKEAKEQEQDAELWQLNKKESHPAIAAALESLGV